MKKSKQLDNILGQLDGIHVMLKHLKVSVRTLDAVNAACEAVELEVRQAAVDEMKIDQ